MELPIMIKYEDNFMSTHDQTATEHVRLIQVDNIYIVSVITWSNILKQFLYSADAAFDSDYEAYRYLIEDLQIEIEYPQGCKPKDDGEEPFIYE